MADNMLHKVTFGFKYTSLSTIITSLLQIVYTAVISRLLEPKDFGILAIAQIIIHFAIEFGTMGLRQAVIQKKELTSEDKRVSFTITMGLSLFLTIVVWFSAPLWANFFEISNNMLTKIIRVLSLSFVIRGVAITANAIMIRELKFKEDATNSIISYVIGYIVIGIGCAAAGMGVWSLVYAQLGQLASASIIPFFFVRHSFRPMFNWNSYTPLFSYGSKMTITGIISNFSFETPRVLIGKFFGEVQLGLFRQASWLIYVPLIKVVQSIQSVIFPLFSRIQDNTEKLRKSFLVVLTLLSLVVFPVCIGVSAASREIILIMFGPKYEGSIPMLSIICFGIGFRLISQLLMTVCDASANLNKRLLIEIFYAIAIVIMGLIFKNHGILGYIVILSLMDFFRNLALVVIVSQILKISMVRILKRYSIGLIFALITGGVIYLISLYINRFHELPLALIFSIQIFVGIATISILVVFLSPRVLRDLLINYLFKMSFFQNKLGKKMILFIVTINPKFK